MFNKLWILVLWAIPCCVIFSCNKNVMKEIWEININQEDKNSLLGKIDYVITDNESVFIRTFDALKSYSQSSGALNWEIELKHWNNELCYNNDVILIGVENKLYCVNKSHGEIN